MTFLPNMEKESDFLRKMKKGNLKKQNRVSVVFQWKFNGRIY